MGFDWRERLQALEARVDALTQAQKLADTLSL
jgi:hypothetical protein